MAAAPFDSFERTPVELSEPFDETRTHEIVHLKFGSSGHNGHPENIVEGQYFRSKEPGKKSLVVVMPIWGTSSYPPEKISTGYARKAGNETHVIWIYGTAPIFPWDELSSVPTEEGFREMGRESAERFRTAIVDMRRLVDWAATQPEIDASRIAFVGFSMSALVTSTLVANEPRIAGAVLMMGAAKFAEFTRNHIGDILAIVLDDVIISAPNIESAIEGPGQISGGFRDMRDARLHAQLMNAGSLPVPLKPAQTQIVGATLGQDSIERSITAGLVGLGLVLLFMLGYYLLPGLKRLELHGLTPLEDMEAVRLLPTACMLGANPWACDHWTVRQP